MGPSAILLALFASNLAEAGARIDKYTGSIGDVTLDQTVEVALYSTPSGGPSPALQVMIGDNSYLFLLLTSTDFIYINDDVVKAEKLKAKEGNQKLINLKGKKKKWMLGGKQEFVRIDEMRIGDMVLSDVVLNTKDPNAGAPSSDFYRKQIRGDVPAGYIGLSALPDHVSWAIRPSKGTVSFATGDGVAALNALEGGTTLPYRTATSFEGKFGKQEYIVNTNDLVVDGTLAGQSAGVVLEAAGYSANYDSRLDVGDAVTYESGDLDLHYVPVTVGGLDLGSNWSVEQTGYEQLNVEFQAGISAAWLSGFDMSVDRLAQTVTIAPAITQNRKDPLPFLIEAAQARMTPKDTEEKEQADEGDGAESTSEEQPPGSTAAWSDLADLHEAAGDYNSSLEARAKALAFDERDCTAQFKLGVTQLEAGRVADSIMSLERASQLYREWYGYSLDDRAEKEKALGKLDADEKKTAEDHPAASSCHEADGSLAGALLAAGDFETVASMYRERLDLDPDLAQMAANALIAQGHYKAAHEPLRQAAKMNQNFDTLTDLGLGMVYAKSGDWYTAQGYFERSLYGGGDTMSIEIWLDSLSAAVSPEAAVKAAQGFVRQNPQWSGAYFGLARAASMSGEAESIEGAQALGDAFFAGKIEEHPRSGSIWANYARYLVVWERTEEAQMAAELALQFAPGNAAAWMAMADVQTAKGNPDRASQMKLRAAQVATGHPGYARFFGQYRN